MADLADYLHLTVGQAREQFQALQARRPVSGVRQVTFVPVETLLCLAASFLVDHRHFGGSTAHQAPEPVPSLARLFSRPPSSVQVIQAHGQPILMLNRDRNRQLPEGQTPFTADGVVYTGNFAKIALNVAHRAGQPGNVLADLLRSWFGADVGQPGTVQYVELVPGEPHWQMRPASPSPVAGRGQSVG